MAGRARCLGFLVLGCAWALTIALPAMAQDELARARALYNECATLLASDQPCDALDACARGLEARRLAALEELADKARAACDKQQKTQGKPCPEGMERFANTRGHCCWPGQVWSTPAGEELARCVGTPSRCPAGHMPDRELATCRKTCDEEGRIETVDGHCCWPGQAWSPLVSACVGLPHCPEFYQVELVPRTGPEAEVYEVEECTLSDNDRDGILDAGDVCPNFAEDFDQFEDEDGCPEPDNDRDGICDENWAPSTPQERLIAANCKGVDHCPLVPEDPDDFEDFDGCPDFDHDGDGICDPVPVGFPVQATGCTGLDLCLGESEVLNGYLDDDGCSDRTPSEVAAEEARIALEAQRAAARDTYERLGYWGWGVAAFGAVLAGTGTAVLVESQSQFDAIAPKGSGPTVVADMRQSELSGELDSINKLKDLGWSGVAIGGAALVTGVVLVIYADYADHALDRDRDTGAAWQVGLGIPGATWQALSVVGVF